MIAALALILTMLASSSAAAHEWYTGQRSPSGRECCGAQDCRPTTARLNEQGELEVLSNGVWFPAFDPNFYLGPSPDGSWTACQMPSERSPRCVWGAAGT